MSSFKDTFTRDQRKEPLLSYDANASLYFAATVLIVILLPWTWKLIKTTFFPSYEIHDSQFPSDLPKDSHIKFCGCSVCAEKVETMKKDRASWSKRFTKSFFIQAIIVLSLWLSFYLVCTNINSDTSIHAFDPFEILGIPRGSSDKDIKRAYRSMSLKWHPDKNPNNPQAEHMFMLISKAQLALTDEIAKRNYEKYGNPDGPTSMKVGIGLPPFLVAEENQIYVLVGFFLIILLVLPLIFISYFMKQRKFASNGLQNESLQIAAGMITVETKIEYMINVIAASAESRNMVFTINEKKIIEEIASSVPSKYTPKFSNPIVVRNYYIILAHIYRLHNLLTPEMKKDLDTLIHVGLSIFQTVLEVSCLRGLYNVAVSAIQFRKMLVQAIGFGPSDQLYQLPHLTKADVINLSKKFSHAKGFSSFCQLTDDEKTELLDGIDKEKIEDIKLFCRHASDFEVFVEAETKGEVGFAVGDIVTFTVHVVRRNLREGEFAGPVHAPLLNEPVFEKIHVFLLEEKGKEQTLLSFATIKQLGAKEECAITVPAKNAGNIKYKVAVFSDSYAGIDTYITTELKVLKHEDADRKIAVHPDDADLDNHPTLFEQMMGMATAAAESDNEEEVVDE